MNWKPKAANGNEPNRRDHPSTITKQEAAMHDTTCRCAQCRQASALNETQEIELALELLEVGNEADLEQFLGKLIRRVGKIGKGLLKPLAGVLKPLAKVAMPFIGGALGSFIPIPGVGTALGTALGGAVSKALEVEFEGMDREMAELERAQRFVRMAADVAQRLQATGNGSWSDSEVQSALLDAARRHLPMLQPPQAPMQGNAGRWVRRGSQIQVQGI
jgi:hypothetical protein